MTVAELKKVINNIPAEYDEHEIFTDDSDNEYYSLVSELSYILDSTLYKNAPGYVYLTMMRR